jgi:bifunctional non-homologous end joining protein LigD
MPLDEYRRKRDFTTSPEPAGDEEKTRRARRAKPLFFCVQKHLASHLHYDFRLEYNGVLLSWAVPKGPSLDPKTKRLAMQVEDHPFEYGRFEGVIPSGYGAGLVMLWDEGTWVPELDVEAGFRKGDLKFRLDGYKLKGSWALIRTRGYGDGRGSGKSWLLIKHKDEWSGDLDITTFAPLSVKSGEDFPEILARDEPDLWKSGRPAEGGATGAMLREIIEKAAALKHQRQTDRDRGSRSAARPTPTARPSKPAAKAAKPAKPASRRATHSKEER